MVVPGVPFSLLLTSLTFAFLTSIPSISSILSPAFNPALSAGKPSYGSFITTPPSLYDIIAPTPAYSPVVRN